MMMVIGGFMGIFEEWRCAMDGNEAGAICYREMDKRIDKQIDANCVWDIDRLDSRRQIDAYSYSEYFYATMELYKSTLSLYAFGPDDKLRIFLIIHGGFRNDLMKWPFSADVTITIRNRATPDACRAITNHCTIQQPDNNSNNWSDAFDFSYSDLSSASLLANDCFTVECRVDRR